MAARFVSIMLVLLFVQQFCRIQAQAAEQDDPAKMGIDCKTAFSTPAVELCYAQDYHAANLRLDAAYQATIASIDEVQLPPDVRAKWHEALVESQRRWIAFRDAECALTGYEWYGGSGQTGAEIDCMTELTKSRIEALQHHAGPR